MCARSASPHHPQPPLVLRVRRLDDLRRQLAAPVVPKLAGAAVAASLQGGGQKGGLLAPRVMWDTQQGALGAPRCRARAANHPSEVVGAPALFIHQRWWAPPPYFSSGRQSSIRGGGRFRPISAAAAPATEAVPNPTAAAAQAWALSACEMRARTSHANDRME